MKRIVIVLSVAFLSILLLSGCLTTNNISGTPINKETVQKIENGKTTRDEILQWFGAPDKILDSGTSVQGNAGVGGQVNVSVGKNQEIYVYEYVKTKGSVGGYIIFQSNTQTKKDTLIIWIDKTTGIVSNHAFTKQTGENTPEK